MENTAVITSKEIIYLSVDKIRTNPYQPRKFFDKDKLLELSKSIREYGVMQPISVRLINGRFYELVAGERRLRATKMAGIANIPAILVNINDQDSAIIAIIENLQRENLNYLEEAEGFINLINDYSFTQEELAERIGKSQSTIANKIRILKLSPDVKKLLLKHDLSERHARALLRLPDEEGQISVIKKIAEFQLTVKATEDYIEDLLKNTNVEKQHKVENVNSKRYIKDIRLFTNTIKQAVDIMKKSGVGTDYIVSEKSDGYEIKIVITY